MKEFGIVFVLFTFAGSIYFDRMKNLGFYSTDSNVALERVKKASMEGLYDKKDPHHDDALSIKDYINTYNELTVINTTVPYGVKDYTKYVVVAISFAILALGSGIVLIISIKKSKKIKTNK